MSEFKLPPVCDRAAVQTLHSEWTEAVGDDPIVLVGSDVETMSHAMLQLLVSAARTGGGVIIADPSEPLRSAITLAGLEDTLLEADSQ